MGRLRATLLSQRAGIRDVRVALIEAAGFEAGRAVARRRIAGSRVLGGGRVASGGVALGALIRRGIDGRGRGRATAREHGRDEEKEERALHPESIPRPFLFSRKAR